MTATAAAARRVGGTTVATKRKTGKRAKKSWRDATTRKARRSAPRARPRLPLPPRLGQ